MRFVTDKLLLRREIQWVSDYFTTSKWATDKTGNSDFTYWSNYTSSDPIEDVDAGKEAILSVTGREGNTLVLGYQVYRKLIRHPLLREQIKYTSAENLNEALLAKIFDVKRVLVAKAIKATNKENETAAYAFTHGKNALLCHVPDAPSVLTPAAGYTFSWKLVSGSMGKTVGVKKFRIEQLGSDRVEGEIAIDMKIVGADLGYFFASAIV
jgi:hypothetical protein